MAPFTSLTAALAIVLFASSTAIAFPTKPITIVVPNPPGGSSDIAARLLAQKLSESMGQPVIVENRPGAGGTIGTQQVAKAAPDGYTLLITSSQHTINPFLFKNAGFHPVKDLTPITSLVVVETVLVVNPSFAAKSLPELISLAKARPGALQYASPGNGTFAHLLSEMLNSRAGINIQHVPYKGVAAAGNDVVAGHVPMVFASLPSVTGHIAAGRLRALAVSSPKRAPSAPDVPTIGETLPGFSAEFWIGLFAPPGVSQEILTKLHSETVKALNSASLKEKFVIQGATVSTLSPDKFTSMLNEELLEWQRVVAETGMKLD